MKYKLTDFGKKILLNEVPLRNMICKWSRKSMTKPKVQKLVERLK